MLKITIEEEVTSMENEKTVKPKKQIKKGGKITLIILGSVVGILLLFFLFVFINSKVSSKVKVASTATNTTGLIQAINRGLYDKDGKEIILEGCNIGGLFVTEGWINPYCIEDMSFDGSSYNYHELSQDNFLAGFKANPNLNDEQREELMEIYYENWFTLDDAKKIKDIGMNCIRLPFYWRDILNEESDGTITLKTKSESEGDVYENLDRVVNICKEAGLYVILDLHGCPGSQNGYEHGGSSDYNKTDADTIKFWYNEAYVDAVVSLWDEVSNHYKESETIASYDIINEPRSKKFVTDKTCWDVMDKIYDAIRENGDNHVVTMEGCWSFSALPNPKTYSWVNVQYSYHWYNWFKSKGLTYTLFYMYQDISNVGRNYNVPVSIGEFTFFDNEKDWNNGLSMFKSRHFSWTMWTYKMTVPGWWTNSWGIYNLKNRSGKAGYQDWKDVNVKTATYDEIKPCFQDTNTNNTEFAVTSNTYNYLRKYFGTN